MSGGVEAAKEVEPVSTSAPATSVPKALRIKRYLPFYEAARF